MQNRNQNNNLWNEGVQHHSRKYQANSFSWINHVYSILRYTGGVTGSFFYSECYSKCWDILTSEINYVVKSKTKVRPHIAHRIQDLIAPYGWDEYTTDPAFNDYHQFRHSKKYIGDLRHQWLRQNRHAAVVNKSSAKFLQRGNTEAGRTIQVP